MTLLKLEDLRAYYRTEVYGVSRSVRAVDGVSLELNENEIYGVAGESSCGKTTLIKVISGTVKPPLRIESGSVRYQFGGFDADMLTINQEEMRRNVRWKVSGKTRWSTHSPPATPSASASRHPMRPTVP